MKYTQTSSKNCPHCEETKVQVKKTSYIYNLLVAFDQLGNAIAGGDPDSTISARVGFFANQGENLTKYPRFWKFLEKIINFAFWPVDGNNHCKDAYESDPEKHFRGKILAKIIILLLSVSFSLIISGILYLIWFIFPGIRNKYVCEKCRKHIKKVEVIS